MAKKLLNLPTPPHTTFSSPSRNSLQPLPALVCPCCGEEIQNKLDKFAGLVWAGEVEKRLKKLAARARKAERNKKLDDERLAIGRVSKKA